MARVGGHRALLLAVWGVLAVVWGGCGGGDEVGPAGDDVLPTIVIADASAREDEGALVFTVGLSAPAAKAASVSYATRADTATETTDFAASSGTLRFEAGEQTKAVSVPVVADDEVEGDELLVLEISAPVGVTLVDTEAGGTIVDDDAPPFLALDASALESDTEVAVSVSLPHALGFAVEVDFTTAPGEARSDVDFVASSGTLVFAAGETTHTILVALLDDAVDEDPETFTLTLADPSLTTATVTLLDDDAPPAIGFVLETQAPDESAGTIEVAVELSEPSERRVSVPFMVSPSPPASDADFTTLTPSPLTLEPGVTSAVIAIDLVDDAEVEAAEELVLALGASAEADAGAITTHLLTILDDDEPPPPLELLSATTLDSDADGRIDHYRLVFSQPVSDATFPGYDAASAEGQPQSHWLVAGYGEVVLVRGAVAPELDVEEDETLYLRFTESAAPDGGATPELTTTATPALRSGAGVALAPVLAETVAEGDGAFPVLLSASTETGLAHLVVHFSEPVVGGDGGDLDVTGLDLAYVDVSGGGVGGLAAAGDLDGTDGTIAPLTDSGEVFGPEDVHVDEVGAIAGRIHDLAGNPIPLAPATRIGGIIRPFVLSVVSVNGTTLQIEYSEPVADDAALDPANYAYEAETCEAPAGGVSEGVALGGSVYRFTTPTQTAGCVYRLTVSTAVTDVDEGAALAEPRAGTFIGRQQLRVVSAEALSLRSFVVSFSKAVRATGEGGADDVGRYSLPPDLGAVLSAARYDTVSGLPADANKVRVTHETSQGAAFYSVVVATTLLTEDGLEALAPNPLDRTTFAGLGGNVTTVEQGSMFSDPFGDGSSFSFVFAYAGKVYAGPNDNNDAVFRFDPDGGNAVTVTFRTDSATAGGPFTSFGKSLVRPASRVESPAASVARYFLTPGSDLSAFIVGNPVSVTGCASLANEVAAGALSGVDDALDFVEVTLAAPPVPSEAETCQVALYNEAGPARFDGVDAFVSARVGGQDYLVFGGHDAANGGFPEIFFTSDTDALLDNSYCDISAVTLGNTKSLQTIHGFGGHLYIGFASSQADQPILATLGLTVEGAQCAALDDQVTVGGTNKARGIPYIGGSGSPRNGAAFIGIDSMAFFDDGRGTMLYVANNGGVVRTADLPPTGATVWTRVAASDAVWTSGTTQPIPDIGKLRPGEKGVPFMTEWGGSLFVARNRTDGVAEVWSYPALTRAAPAVDNPSGTRTRYFLPPGTDLSAFAAAGVEASATGCTVASNDAGRRTVVAIDDAADTVVVDDGVAGVAGDSSCTVVLTAPWRKVIDTASAAGGMNVRNTDVSLLAVSGGRLYVGFDNPSDGAELWRTDPGVTAATLAAGAPNANISPVGASGLGPAGASDLARNKHIISSTSVPFDGKDYLYVTVGCTSEFVDNGACDRDRELGATDFAIRMFRQVD